MKVTTNVLKGFIFSSPESQLITPELTPEAIVAKRNARLAGVLYLLVIICAGFSQGYVRANLVVPGDAVLTAQNILADEWLFRLGLTSDLTAFLLDAVISVIFFFMFRHVSTTLALVSTALRLLAHPAIGSLNLLNHYLALEVLKGNYLTSFTRDQLDSLSLLFMDAHRNGYLIAGVFFGLHCLLLGILIYRSGMIPKVFGILMIIAAIGYFMESFGNFLFPGNEEWLAWVVGLAAALGEVELTLYLLIKGLKKSFIAEPQGRNS